MEQCGVRGARCGVRGPEILGSWAHLFHWGGKTCRVLPFPLQDLRGLLWLAWDHALCRAVVALYVQAVLGWYRRQARMRGVPNGRGGAVVIVQRFGSALNLNVHRHAMVLDGVFARDADGAVRFHAAPTEPPPDLMPLLVTIGRRMHRLLARRGVSDGSDGVEVIDPFADDAPTLAGLAAASVRGVAALGPRAGRPVRRWGDDRFVRRTDDAAPRPWHARIRGFDLHAAVAVRAGARDRLCRYALRPAVGQERLRLAADGQVVLDLRRRWADGTTQKDATGPDPLDGADVGPERTGVFTSGIVATRDGQRIALFFTGRRHAGENLATVLAQRAPSLGPPLQMCDALSRNPPKAFKVILAHCLAHARRHVVDVTPNFPSECRHVLETLRDVYHDDAQVRERGLSPLARLTFHQTHSRPRMDALHTWCTTQLDDHLVEPHSGLGQAITYFLKHWTPLTRFLEIAGASLDNTLVERALKKAILHRKGALFYKTLNGVRVGDLFMSLIHTCELNDVNPFAYLVALQQHADALTETPAA